MGRRRKIEKKDLTNLEKVRKYAKNKEAGEHLKYFGSPGLMTGFIKALEANS